MKNYDTDLRDSFNESEKNCGAFDKCQVLDSFSGQGFEETKDVFHVLMKDNKLDGVLNGVISDPKRNLLAIFSCTLASLATRLMQCMLNGAISDPKRSCPGVFCFTFVTCCLVQKRGDG